MFAKSSLFVLLFLLLGLTSTQAKVINDDSTAIIARHFGGISGVVQGALNKRATLLSPPVCTDKSVQLSSHDCNVALLSTGAGISGSVEFLRVAATTTTGRSGDCAVTVTAINGGTAIDVSKGRFEQGFKSFKAVCGVSPGTVDVLGGSTGGDIRITVLKN